jgi:hypothetical protein
LEQGIQIRLRPEYLYKKYLGSPTWNNLQHTLNTEEAAATDHWDHLKNEVRDKIMISSDWIILNFQLAEHFQSSSLYILLSGLWLWFMDRDGWKESMSHKYSQLLVTLLPQLCQVAGSGTAAFSYIVSCFVDLHYIDIQHVYRYNQQWD